MEEIVDMVNKKGRKLKILCLHGYYNNVDVMKYQFDYYEKIFEDYVDFVYINGYYENHDIFDYSLYKMFKDKAFYSWVITDQKTNKPSSFIDSMEYVIDYMDSTGPYDGLLGFSQGTYLVRTILKVDEFQTKFPRPKHIPDFGIIVAGPLELKYLGNKEHPHDKYKYWTAFKQPMLYMYGEKDMLLKGIEFGVIKEGDFTVIKHSAGHNVPKLINEEMDQFINFIDKVYYNKFGEHIHLEKSVDEEYKENYAKAMKQKALAAKL